jgi:acyl carrier protein
MSADLEKYESAFVNAFNVDAQTARTLKYQDIPAWDSVGHMTLIAELEDAFDITMETDDMIALSSFEVGKNILAQKYDVQF